MADSGPEGWDAWLGTLARFEALGATTVVCGHRAPGRADDPADLGATAQYLRDFRDAVPKSASAEALISRMSTAYPGLALPIVLAIGAKAAFARRPAVPAAR